MSQVPSRTPTRERFALICIQLKRNRFVTGMTFAAPIVYILALMTCIMLLGICILLPFVLPRIWAQGSTASTQYVGFGVMIALTCLILYIETRQAISSFRGYWTIFHAPPEQSASFQWRPLLAVTLPMWLRVAEVVPDPSPTSALEKVGGSPLTVEELQQMYQEIMHDTFEEPATALSLRLTLTHKVALSVIGDDGKQETIPFFAGSHKPAVLAFLALQPRGEWIQRNVILKQVYGSITKVKVFNKDVERLAEDIRDTLVDAHFIGPDTDLPGESFTLLENRKDGNTSYWRLRPDIEIEEYPTLHALQQRLFDAETGERLPVALSCEERRSICHHLREEIGEGFLADYQSLEDVWGWAEEHYVTYRNTCLDVFDVIAEMEVRDASTNASTSIEEKQAAARAAVKVWRWIIQVALGIVPDETRARSAMMLCLKTYRQQRYRSAAASLSQTYGRRMRELDETWQADVELASIWPEVTQWPIPGKKGGAKGIH